jgi:molybdopterin-guanine dinucleotide biosynthesis protein A
MGRDKAWLQKDDRPLIAWQLERVAALQPKELIISGRPGTDYSAFPHRVVYDFEADRGPLGGIAAAFASTTSPHLLVLAVDLPLMTPDWLRRLIDRRTPGGGVVPRIDGQWQPLAAIYPRACHPLVANAMARDARVVTEFVRAAVAADYVISWDIAESDRLCLTNWNCPENLETPQTGA